jgi:hypothetical protein
MGRASAIDVPRLVGDEAPAVVRFEAAKAASLGSASAYFSDGDMR